MKGASSGAVIAAAVTVAVAPALARAQASELPTAALHYEAPSGSEGCPDEQSLRDLVVARMGRDPFVGSPPGEQATIVARVTMEASGLAAEVELLDRNADVLGTRRIAADRGECDELVAALAVAISIVLDPASYTLAVTDTAAAADDDPQANTGLAPARPADPSDHIDPERPPALAEMPPEVTVAVDSAPPPSTDAVRLGLAASVLGSVGVLPAAAIGAQVSAELRWRRLLTAVELRVVTTPASASIGGLEVIATRASIGAAPCLAIGFVAACLPADVGVLELRPPEGSVPVRTVVASLGLRLLGALVVHDVVELRAWIEGGVSLIQPTIRVNGEPAWTSPTVAGTAGIGLVVWP